MPWMNLGVVLGLLQSRRIDSAEMLVYLTPRDVARLRRRSSVNSFSDLGDSESNNYESADEEEQEEGEE